MLYPLIIFVTLCVNSIIGYRDLEEGDKCRPTSGISEGKCVILTECEDAISYLRKGEGHPFERCGFKSSMEIVCCPKKSSSKNPPIPDHKDRSGVNDSPRISDKKCKEIINTTIPPLDVHIIGGEDAVQGEFPHMAALGYLNPEGVYVFNCGGSLISEYYVITAAHCVDNIDQIEPSIARLGVVEIGKNVFNPETDIRISKIISHPSRTSLYKYHDLALLRLAQRVDYSVYVVPACLYTAATIPNVALTVSGWGKISVNKDLRSTILQKANVTEMENSKCEKGYANWRKLPNGISQGQFCAGDPQGRTDTCQGDSGGPLQGLTARDGHYRLIGITSFGRGCGSLVPGVYTRVYTYLDWIESIVWPNGV